MTEVLTNVGVPGIAVFLILREVFGFISKRRNGSNGQCPSALQRRHGETLAGHDQSLRGICTDIKRIDTRLGRIEEHLLRNK